MAPLPPNSTKRYFLDYTVCTFQHTLEMRVSNDTDDAAASAAFEDLFTAVNSALFATVINGMRVSAEGSDLSFPATFTGALSYGTGVGTPADTAGYLAYFGRTSTGRRWRIQVFGSSVTATGGNWRASPGESSPLDAGRAVVDATTDQWLGIDGNKPILNSYANTGYSAYWRNKVR